MEELDRARELAGEIGGEVVEADVTDREQVEPMLESIGSLDLLVNNAADQSNQALLDTDRATWDRTLAVNVTGQMLTIQASVPRIGAGSSIVNVASIHSSVPLRGAAAYAASKGAVAMLTGQAAVELADREIRVNAVAPGAIDVGRDQERAGGDRIYEHLPLRRAGRPEEVAAVVAFLASGEASYVTGAVWTVDGGALVQDLWRRR